jgi:hypothetical protein
MITEFVEFFVGTHGCASLQKPNFLRYNFRFENCIKADCTDSCKEFL